MTEKNTSHSLLIGKNIRKQRLLANMKGETLAIELGITKAAISQLENGLVDIKFSTLYRLSQVFNVPISLFTSEIENTPFSTAVSKQTTTREHSDILKEIHRNVSELIVLLKVEQNYSQES